MSFWKATSQAWALRHWGQRPFFWSVVCLSLLCLLCLKVLGGNGQVRQLRGALAGRITRAPVSPVILPNVSYAPSPVANVKVMVMALNGQRFATSITNEKGYFRIALAPGTYQVTLGPLGGMAFSKDVPATVSIKAKGEVWMEIHIDTGIR